MTWNEEAQLSGMLFSMQPDTSNSIFINFPKLFVDTLPWIYIGIFVIIIIIDQIFFLCIMPSIFVLLVMSLYPFISFIWRINKSKQRSVCVSSYSTILTALVDHFSMTSFDMKCQRQKKINYQPSYAFIFGPFLLCAQGLALPWGPRNTQVTNDHLLWSHEKGYLCRSSQRTHQ